MASSSFRLAPASAVLPTMEQNSTENMGTMGHFPASSYGLGLSSRLLQAPFCDFSSKNEVSSILLHKKWYSESEGHPKRADAVKQKSLPEAEEILSKSARNLTLFFLILQAELRLCNLLLELGLQKAFVRQLSVVLGDLDTCVT